MRMDHRNFLYFALGKHQATTNNVDFPIREQRIWGWRDGSLVKITCCSSRRLEFRSQHPHWAAYNGL